jgi:hypothetical protein
MTISIIICFLYLRSHPYLPCTALLMGFMVMLVYNRGAFNIVILSLIIFYFPIIGITATGAFFIFPSVIQIMRSTIAGKADGKCLIWTLKKLHIMRISLLFTVLNLLLWLVFFFSFFPGMYV